MQLNDNSNYPPSEHNKAMKFWITLRLNWKESPIYREIAVEGSETFSVSLWWHAIHKKLPLVAAVSVKTDLRNALCSIKHLCLQFCSYDREKRIKSDFATGECCSLLSHTVPIQRSTHWSYTMQRRDVLHVFHAVRRYRVQHSTKISSGDSFGIRKELWRARINKRKKNY